MKLRKQDAWAVVAIVVAAAALLFSVSAVIAEETQQYNEEQTAYNEAIRIVIERGCVPKFARSKPYTVVIDDEKVRIVAKEVTQNCKVKGHLISWKPPTADVNGNPLPAGFITGYNLTVNGELLAVTSATKYAAGNLASGDVVGLQTLGKNGLNSKVVTAVVE